MSEPFTVNSLENALASLNAQIAPQKANHFVINLHKDCNQYYNTNLTDAINKASEGQVLYRIDLRPIFHGDGTPDKWSVEACSDKKSLATIGELPSA